MTCDRRSWGMIHGCHIGAGSVVEPGAIACDGSSLGRGCLIRARSLIKQRDVFGDMVVVDGFPGKMVEALTAPLKFPAWAIHRDALATLAHLPSDG